MNLPKDSPYRKKYHEPKVKKHTWIAVVAIIAIIISVASAGFSAFVYLDTPLQVHNYVQSHKNELKGADGRDGMDGRNGYDGMDGRNGSNSYSPTHCSSYDYGYGHLSTNCY